MENTYVVSHGERSGEVAPATAPNGASETSARGCSWQKCPPLGGARAEQEVFQDIKVLAAFAEPGEQ